MATGRCSGHPPHSPLTRTDSRSTSPVPPLDIPPWPEYSRTSPTGRRTISSQGLRAAALAKFFSLSPLSQSPFTGIAPPASFPGLSALSVDGTLGGHCLERFSLPPAPDPTLSPAPPQSVSLELPQEASSGLPLPTQIKMVLSATYLRTTLRSEQS